MMFIENWLAAVVVAGLFALALVPSIGWFAESMRLEKAEKENKYLISERAALRVEVLRLKSLAEFHKHKDEDPK